MQKVAGDLLNIAGNAVVRCRSLAPNITDVALAVCKMYQDPYAQWVSVHQFVIIKCSSTQSTLILWTCRMLHHSLYHRGHTRVWHDYVWAVCYAVSGFKPCRASGLLHGQA